MWEDRAMIIAVASGNGGTGGITLVATFVAFADNKVIAGWTHQPLICRGKKGY
ncbi:MAG: hypothetical protein U9R10_01700 [Euryarchaeota archaeon]|nr:hypothetical protein [Euryarchaeota archaeon]